MFGVIKIRLGDFLIRQTGTNVTATEMKRYHKDNGEIKIFAGGNTTANVDRGSIANLKILSATSIIVKSRGNIDFEFYDKPFSHKNELWSYRSEFKEISLKYVYYYLKNNVEYFRKRAISGKLPQISIPVTDDFVFPLPTFKEQERIVSILDRFDMLCNDLQSGLPAEIEARKKQYEYYRDKLLTFKESTAS